MFYSQFGEDRILSRIFPLPQGVCVEVGANNGLDGSTSLYFEEAGWRCVLVEPIPELCASIRARRKAQVFECAASSQEGKATLQVAIGSDLAHAVSALGDSADHIHNTYGFQTAPIQVSTRRLDDILDEAGLEPGMPFISIDVEGHELELLKGFSTDRWRPRILIIEDNAAWGSNAVSREMARRGYLRFRRTGVNDWYASKADPLASFSGRLGYYPAMLWARFHMSVERVLTPVWPMLGRLPGGPWCIAQLRKMMGRPPTLRPSPEWDRR